MPNQEAQVRVLISRNGSVADVMIPTGQPEEISPNLVSACLSEAGVHMDDHRRQVIKDALAQRDPELECRFRVATWTPPIHGVDGHIKWEPQFDPDAQATPTQPIPDQPDPDQPESATNESEPQPADQADEEPIDFYSKSAFVMVNVGDRLGTLVQPVEGTDGIDVRGNAVAAKQPKPCRFKFDESIMPQGAGELIAQTSGVLSISRDTIAIREYLEIPTYVDFSTGHIDFQGDILIMKGVRDLFNVTAKGTLEVRGLVESAHLKALGSITLKGGAAGREDGIIEAGASLTARYLDALTATVGQNLTIEREAINCNLTVGGAITSKNASIIGGKTLCLGAIIIGTLGSEMNTPTKVRVGSVPTLESKVQRLEKIIESAQKALDKHTTELQFLSMPGRKVTPHMAERHTELSYSVHSSMSQLDKAKKALKALQNKIESLRVVDITVQKTIHQGVIISVGDNTYRFKTSIRGPLRILRNKQNSVVYQSASGGALMPISHITELQLSAA